MASKAELPAPLSPPDCDLRGYDFMPLYGHRLFGSDFDSKATDAEFRIAMRLWWAAWQQCPAGSLPNDDAALCRLADLGRDIKSWKKVRDMVLRNFVLCSDGKLYHPLICSEAKDAWERRRRDRERKAKMREAKRNNDGGDGGGTRVVPRHVRGLSHDASMGQSASVPRTNGSCPTDEGVGQGADATMDVPVDRTEVRKEVRKQEQNDDDSDSPLPRENVVEFPMDGVAVPVKDQPRRNDPEHRWACLASIYEGKRMEGVDEDSPSPKRMFARNGTFISWAAEAVMQAAGVTDERWRGDWMPLVRWLDDGYEPHQITDAIAKQVAQPRYNGFTSLMYFDKSVRAQVPEWKKTGTWAMGGTA
ncbi:MAG: hypothetical protein NVS1B6_18120 [Steroidobacteraceae bacterium]